MDRKNIVDAINDRKEKVANANDEKLENLKKASKEIFKDENGKYFLQFLNEICLWNEQDFNINNEILIYKKGRKDIWTIIRTIIPKDILADIEIYNN